MRTSNLHFNPFQTVIRDGEGVARYFVTTAYAPEEFYCHDDDGDDWYPWKTSVFQCDPVTGKPKFYGEFDVHYSCGDTTAMRTHLELVEEYFWKL